MRKKWKCLSALCLAGLLGCMVPMSTMQAAEGAETPETISGNDIIESDILPVQDDLEIAVLSERDDASDNKTALTGIQQYAVGGDDAEPEIAILFESGDCTEELGGEIKYQYINHNGGAFTISVQTQGSALKSLAYYLDPDGSEVSKSQNELDSLWKDIEETSTERIEIKDDGKYVLYVKAESEDNQICYARSDGVVVDTAPPEISGIESGGTYSEGTVFQVKDANLETVHINQDSVSPDGNGNYYVTAKSATEPSCEIKARDRAGNETTISVTVTETVQEPGEGNIITQSGAYSLKAGIPYHLSVGNWTVVGDGTVYSGGVTFYVVEDRIYLFRKL